MSPVPLQRAARPNVVLVISDQQRADTMPGVREAPEIHTPHLDWLAARGTSFRRAYCVTPLCSPARATLLSGLYPHTTGLVANCKARPVPEEMRLSPDVRLLADYLQPLGYACAYTGKWHLGTGADRRGFSDFVSRSGSFDVDSPDQVETVRFGQRVGLPISGRYAQNNVRDDYNPETRLGSPLAPLAFQPSMYDATRAAYFVRRMAHEEQPFLLAYSCHEPHPPFVSPHPFNGMYAPETMPLPPTRRHDDGPRLVADRPEHHLLPVAPLSDDQLRAMWAAYYGAVSYVDHLVGILLAALVETDQLDNTLFVFTSDHGEMLGDHGLWSKGCAFYEELMNVPLLIVPPGGTAEAGGARQTGRLVSHADLVPTILRWCGAAAPSDLQGSDIRPLVEGSDAPVHDGVAFEYHSIEWGDPPVPLRGWRTEEWKYVESPDGPAELYELQRDPGETRNVIHEPSSAAAGATMASALRRWLRETADLWPEVPVAGAR